MNRKVMLGIVMMAAIATPSAWPEAAPRKAGETTFTMGWEKDQPTLRAEGRGVKFFKRVGRDTVSIRVEVPGDSVELEAGTNGAVRISRTGRVLRLQMAEPFEANIAKVQKLMVGSKALDGFESLIVALAANDSPQAQSLRSSHALLNAVRGLAVPAARPMPAGTRQATLASVKDRTEGPYACWAEYAHTVNVYN